ncbi:ABC transporter substrate-binding protein [Marinobacterium mangrovicola]|uniref:Peptide/nickel transport system substrate-binding protein n=1 Tax=Marinobacterium mangrovicola TaxID=1476959 RepID=A0A4R1GKL0_9GAMM|nr:ABC transporter substrate-binding protein [Marinobacterium mangrovicola]TCK08628.1 peptide/nickel transport system substrate-binding protein [Marinobacterium mangrovicola]
MTKQFLAKSIAAGIATLVTGSALAACPTVAGPEQGGKYPHLFEKDEFEASHDCVMNFSTNPEIAELNARIAGNPELPALANRIPQEPLVVVPYSEVGRYGGVLDGISKATESGTSDLLSVRHVNLLRFSDDLSTVVPNVAKSWDWNDDYTELTLKLREGHKWSDGAPFTAEDIVFWYNNLILDKNVIAEPNARFLSDGKPMKVEAVDDTTVRFTLNAPKPGMTAMFASDYAQPFQPKHLIGKFHPEINSDADKLAQSLGFENGYEAVKFYYGQSDWKDVPTPLLKDAEKAQALVDAGFTATAPTLESHIVVEDTLEGRRLVANPYFFQVDTAGNQLPYINEISEVYIGDEDIQSAKMIAGEIDYKTQAVNLTSAPVLLENKEQGGYQVALRPTIGMTTFAFNLTDKDAEKREVFNNVNFRRAMSVAINRDQINEVAYFGLGKPAQYTAFDADTAPFITDEVKEAWTEYDTAKAAELLDEAGVVDKDGDGLRDLPSGGKFELDIQYSTQGVATKVVEMVAANWTDVGVKTSIKEVTSDEYRNSQTANDLEVTVWNMGRPQFTLATDPAWLLPPYGTFFDLRTGMEWSQYLSSDGAEGSKPPQTVYEMQKLAEQFGSLMLGSEESQKVGLEIAKRTVDDLFIIGTVKAVKPIYHNNKLNNYNVQKTSSSDYYWAYPYQPKQWFLTE